MDKLKDINKKYKKRTNSSFVISILFFFFVVILTIGLYIFNLTIVNSNENISEDILKKEASVKELEKTPKILAYSIYSLNRNSIIRLEEYSKISLYLNHLSSISRKYNISFNGFNYADGKINTVAIAKSDYSGINYKKVVKFIRDYRRNSDGNNLFDLELIKDVETKGDLVYNVFEINFILKNNINNILAKNNKNTTIKNIDINNDKKKTQEEIRKKIEESLKNK